MSKATKTKHMMVKAMYEYQEPQTHEVILKVEGGRGNNLHEVVNASGDSFLASMPTKFRKALYIKRGSYVIGTPIGEGDKVKAEITAVLMADDIQNLQRMGQWPDAFSGAVKKPDVATNKMSYMSDDLLPPSDSDDDDDEDKDSFMAVPLNRRKYAAQQPADDESSSDEEDEEDEEEDTEERQSSRDAKR